MAVTFASTGETAKNIALQAVKHGIDDVVRQG
jgi:hypothetical protein